MSYQLWFWDFGKMGKYWFWDFGKQSGFGVLGFWKKIRKIRINQNKSEKSENLRKSGKSESCTESDCERIGFCTGAWSSNQKKSD